MAFCVILLKSGLYFHLCTPIIDVSVAEKSPILVNAITFACIPRVMQRTSTSLCKYYKLSTKNRIVNIGMVGIKAGYHAQLPSVSLRYLNGCIIFLYKVKK